MFLVYRRAEGVAFGTSTVHGSEVTRSDVASGMVSDRPDGRFSDVIHANDFIDVRHQLITSGKDLDAVVRESFHRLVRGELKTTVGRGFTTNSQLLTCSGGSEVLKIDQLNGSSSTLPNIAAGVTSGHLRRTYTNSLMVADHHIIEVPINDSTWVAGTISISSFLTSSVGDVDSVDGFYSPNDNMWGGVTGVSESGGIITIDSGSNLIGTTYPLYMEYTFGYDPGNNGFYDVPKEFLEIQKTLYQPIATRDNDVFVRYDNSHVLQTDPTDYVSYKGGNYTESHEFGHDLLYHFTASASSFAVSGEMYNYQVLGVKKVQKLDGGSYGDPLAFTAERSDAGNFTVNCPSISASDEVRVTLITGSGSTASSSMKFFELTKQGRGILDTYETIVVEADEISGSPGTYLVDTGLKPIIAIGTYVIDAGGGHTWGKPFAYDLHVPELANEDMVPVKIVSPETSLETAEVNKFLPILDSTQYEDNLQPTRIKLIRDAAGPHPDKLRVVALVHSYVPSSEAPYSFFYELVPYQGTLSTTEIRGGVEAEGPAVVTSSGSGITDNYRYSAGTVSVTKDNRVVTLGSGSWRYHIAAGDFFAPSGSSYAYRILYVGTDESGTDADTKVTLAEPFAQSTLSGSYYTIGRMDSSNNNYANVIDRMPTYAQEDYLGRSTAMSLGNIVEAVVDVSSKASFQSPLDTLVNDFRLGENKENGSRGRSKFVLTEGANDFIKLGELTPYIKYGVISGWTSSDGYKKVYQAYLFNRSYVDSIGKYRDLTGRLYLLVVSSETSQDDEDMLLTPFSVKDTIDVFELVGRPIVRTS